jgi:hypothetical protein
MKMSKMYYQWGHNILYNDIQQKKCDTQHNDSQLSFTYRPFISVITPSVIMLNVEAPLNGPNLFQFSWFCLMKIVKQYLTKLVKK